MANLTSSSIKASRRLKFPVFLLSARPPFFLGICLDRAVSPFFLPPALDVYGFLPLRVLPVSGIISSWRLPTLLHLLLRSPSFSHDPSSFLSDTRDRIPAFAAVIPSGPLTCSTEHTGSHAHPTWTLLGRAILVFPLLYFLSLF